jgi:hypothetical protein
MQGVNVFTPDLVAPNVVEIVVGCDVVEADTTTQRVLNVWHLFKQNNGAGGISLLGLGNAFMTQINGDIQPLLSAAFTGGFATIRQLDDPTALPITLTNPATGGVAGDRLPTFAAVSVDLVSQARGRCFRGRKHMAPISEDDTGLDELDPAVLTAWQGNFDGLAASQPFDDGNGFLYRIGILSRKNSVLIGPSLSFTVAIFDHFVVNPRLGTMKRRKEGVGA